MTLPRSARFASWLYNRLNRSQYSIKFVIDDKHDVDAFTRLNFVGTEYDRDYAEVQKLYLDAIEAWRKNPIAKRIVEIFIDHVVGAGITLSSPLTELDKFIQSFWYDRRNRMPQRLESMVSEWSISGDLFPVLFFNPANGMSYIRFVVKPRITQIQTAPNDWELELFYVEERSLDRVNNVDPIVWMGFEHPQANTPMRVMPMVGEDGSVIIPTDPPPELIVPDSEDSLTLPPIMGHYSVNRLMGALLGEGDLVSVLTWLLRYSRMLEDRVRLNAAVRTFLWFVTVPSKSVASTLSKYKKPPSAGSVIVKDEDEQWEVQAPSLHANDARHDLEALRRMIYAGTFPPHWFGEKGSSLAEAKAMQAQPQRLLTRRQGDFVYMCQDIIYTAYNRARLVDDSLPELPSTNYQELFTAQVPDIATDDNKDLAKSGWDLAQAYSEYALSTEGQSRTLLNKSLSAFFKFIGEPQSDDVIIKMVDEMFIGAENAGKESQMKTKTVQQKVRSNGHVR